MLGDFWLKLVAIGGIIAAIAGAIFKAGKNHAEVSAVKKRERADAQDTKVRNDVGAMSGDDARKRLRDKWSQQ